MHPVGAGTLRVRFTSPTHHPLFVPRPRCSLLFFRGMLRASTRVHNAMVERVLHAPLAFFHTNPTGRILNRFSKDQGSVDEQLPVVSELAAGARLVEGVQWHAGGGLGRGRSVACAHRLAPAACRCFLTQCRRC